MRRPGQLLLIGGLLLVYVLTTGRTLFHAEKSPIFLSDGPGKVTVELAEGFAAPGIHQFIDGATRFDAINLTDHGDSIEIDWLEGATIPLSSGECLALCEKTTISKEVRVSWMPASKRVALGISLHPDRMSLEDWMVLPGIGASMAEKIEKNRQKYGEFGSFENLTRVPGIGVKRLNTWNQYFFNN